jgi:hypothetical protein
VGLDNHCGNRGGFHRALVLDGKTVTTANAIRFLHFEAAKCRDRDSCEAFCLLLPALLRVLELEPMQDVEAGAFRHEFRLKLAGLPFQDATDRAASRPSVLAHSMQPANTHETTEKLPGARGGVHVAPRPGVGCPA